MSDSPVYFYEVINGMLWRNDFILGLTVSPLQAPYGAEIIFAGNITLRYAVDLLQSPHSVIVGYLETENGAVKTGRAAWDFLWAKWQLYPRADVIGVLTDGQEASYLLKDLDLGEPPRVLAYRNLDDPQPIGFVTQLDAPPDAELPELLGRYAEWMRK